MCALFANLIVLLVVGSWQLNLDISRHTHTMRGINHTLLRNDIWIAIIIILHCRTSPNALERYISGKLRVCPLWFAVISGTAAFRHPASCFPRLHFQQNHTPALAQLCIQPNMDLFMACLSGLLLWHNESRLEQRDMFGRTCRKPFRYSQAIAFELRI